MRTFTFLLLLTYFWSVTSLSQVKKIREKRDEVLIRTKRRWVLSTINLLEGGTGPFPTVVTKLFNDKQGIRSVRFRISGQGVTKDPVDVFSINEMDGTVYALKPIDREQNPSFLVDFDVEDRVTGEVLDKTLAFNVAIMDINDNPPVFTPPVFKALVHENIAEGILPVSLVASDIDETNNDNSRITMRMLSQEPATPVITLRMLHNTTHSNVISQLVFKGCFSREKSSLYTVLVEAKDHGTPSLSSTATVSLIITDSNTHPPVFNTTKYNTQVMEMEVDKEILRMGVKDSDAPNTPAWRAVYTILMGNEEGNYRIVTDPKTNEGVLSVIKGKNYEKSTQHVLKIGVENEDPLFSCVDGKRTSPNVLLVRDENAVTVTVDVNDVNDPPVYENKMMTVFRMEEGDVGDVLYVPKITDEDSEVKGIRYELAEDVAKWLSIDPKTGQITTVKKMDRESPYVKNGTYTVMLRAIDDGQPPATGTGTLVIHLGDKNDNGPRLTSNISVLCGNKADRVTVMSQDADAHPFGPPFTFTLNSDSKELQSQWKFQPKTGPETSLISLQTLPYGNYSVPMAVADQQGFQSEDVFLVVVCDCGDKDVCRGPLHRASNLGGAAVGVLLASLLLLLLLLCFCFVCQCGETKNFQLNLQNEVNQTLMRYNDEANGTEGQPPMFNQFSMIGGQKMENTEQILAGPHMMHQTLQRAGSIPAGPHMMHQTLQRAGSIPLTMISNGCRETMDTVQTLGKSQAWNTNRTNSVTVGRQRLNSRSLLSDWNLEEHIIQKLYELAEKQLDFPEYHPQDYSCEGMSSECALDQLSFSSGIDDLQGLKQLGPKFQTLEEICQEALQERNVKL
ncbi:cadherin-like protein 26 [Trichomycterus rosablanca]|uniref:cadherin-like protein 26 n=1 Tax=Trichomycterus rosablanca TaxID=2290929 RepID=UPI002F359A9E